MQTIRMHPVDLTSTPTTSSTSEDGSAPFVLVLGTTQDGGHPQIGCKLECCHGHGQQDRQLIASLAIVDPRSGERWLVDASPDLPEQLRDLEDCCPRSQEQATLDGIFLTHAHIGHYTGLMYLGREALGSRGTPVWAMPDMRRFLRENGPWSQLVDLQNIHLMALDDGEVVQLNDRLSLQPFLVPHRAEFSETVGFLIRGPARAVAWLPDIDQWGRWSRPVEELVQEVDLALLDGTFYRRDELERDMNEVPHPLIVESMDRLAALPDQVRAGVRFIHFNHTNPALREDSEATQAIRARGFGLARRGDRFSLC
ncbi:MAG: pyrroloquinoline quinone biosynthesis protein PqqB [Deltaproteobacteria bacterium]|nr:pyrroloquinoline quinone biosynthesis protein PqqB [Deltaproteobacteria bacterium]